MDNRLLEHFQNPPHEWSDANSEAAEYGRYDHLRNERALAKRTLEMKCPECGIDLPQTPMFLGDVRFTTLAVHCKKGHRASLIYADSSWSVRR